MAIHILRGTPAAVDVPAIFQDARDILAVLDDLLPARQRERVREIAADLVAVEDELVDGPRAEPGAA